MKPFFHATNAVYYDFVLRPGLELAEAPDLKADTKVAEELDAKGMILIDKEIHPMSINSRSNRLVAFFCFHFSHLRRFV